MWIASTAVVLLVALAVAAAIAVRNAEPFLRAQIVSQVSEHLRARVELDEFHVSLVKGIEAEGKGLRIWPPTNTAGLQYDAAEAMATDKPLISLDSFRFHAPLHFKLGEPVVIRVVELKGLRVDLPPRVKRDQSGPDASTNASKKQVRKGDKSRSADVAQSATDAAKPDATAPDSQADSQAGGQAGGTQGTANKGAAKWLSFVVQRIECTDGMLKLETNKPGKLPLEFEIAKVTLTEITPDGAMKFEAELTNPRPKGLIHSTGHFGPWQTSDPGESAVSGDYTLSHADLATFTGIAGILDSTGRYEGTLRNIITDGDTNTPDFRLTSFGNPLALHTHFHAKVDGTNGDTWLDPVSATLGRSHFTARGQIVRVAAPTDGKPYVGGHDIALDVNVDKARIEDFIALASKSKTQLLTGNLTMKTKLHIPPGHEHVEERMGLDDGEFHLSEAEFVSASIQDKIRSLSMRSQGHPGDVKKTDASAIESAMDGEFTMTGAVVSLSALAYKVPGAQIDLTGTYALQGGALDFAGSAKMQATVSQMVGGWKGLLLKPADRYFKKDGAGTEVPIKISGTREAPQFEVDFGKMKFTAGAKPGRKPDEGKQPGDQPQGQTEEKPQDQPGQKPQ